MKDFLGRELQVGDIVIWGSGFGMYFARVVELTDKDVVTFELGGNPDDQSDYGHFDPGTLIWYSSDYRDVPDSYLIELLTEHR